MESPKAASNMTSHQAIMKCPWQWRQPFLDEKLESRKRKVGDGNFYDPVDPNFVDHLLPGHAKKFCEELVESDEKEKIQREIERLQMKQQEEQHESSGLVFYDSLVFTNEGEGSPAPSTASSDDESEVNSENKALVDSILMMSKAVEKASLLVSPQSSFSYSDEEDAMSSGDEASMSPHPSPCLELVSDNLEEDFFSADDDDLLA